VAGVGAPVGKIRLVLTVVAENGSMRDGVSPLDDVVRADAVFVGGQLIERPTDAVAT
jgi:hypothetical protein